MRSSALLSAHCISVAPASRRTKRSTVTKLAGRRGEARCGVELDRSIMEKTYLEAGNRSNHARGQETSAFCSHRQQGATPAARQRRPTGASAPGLVADLRD